MRPCLILGRARSFTELASTAGVIQLVECQLPKLDVAGSSPVARSVSSLIATFCETAASLLGRGRFCLVPNRYKLLPTFGSN